MGKKNCVCGLVSQLTAICCEAATKERDGEPVGGSERGRQLKAKAKSSCKCRRQHLAYLAGRPVGRADCNGNCNGNALSLYADDKPQRKAHSATESEREREKE